ncbi:MAG: biopolymer transporter ExbD [Pseudohongiellaceae bacterium]
MKFRKQRKELVQVNLTPLIDVVFLLLIFFMVSTSFTRENQLQINLPEASAEEVSTTSQGLTLTIRENGAYALNGRVLSSGSIEVLKKALLAESQGQVDQSLLLVADANASHQSVVLAMDAAGQLGFVNLRIATQEPGSGQN